MAGRPTWVNPSMDQYTIRPFAVFKLASELAGEKQ